MARLVYTAITSLDGYVADAQGSFAWAAPDPDVHAFVNELESGIGTYLYGRRLYEVMVPWETLALGPDQPEEVRDFAELWRSADKVVYSRTLRAASSARTRVESAFDPGAVGRMKAAAAKDLSVGGATLAAVAFRAGLVDEIRLFVTPVAVGGGTPALPAEWRRKLALLDARRFAGGTVLLRYAADG